MAVLTRFQEKVPLIDLRAPPQVKSQISEKKGQRLLKTLSRLYRVIHLLVDWNGLT